MDARTATGQVGVIQWRRQTDGTGAAGETMRQIIGHHLDVIRRESVVVRQHVVANGAAGSLKEISQAK